jgi:hypothetical protein
MKTNLQTSRNDSGSILVIALVMAGLLGVSLISYLLLMNHQNRMVFRGQAWNHALALAEAGVEDGLAQLNRTFGTNNSRGGVNGWSGSSLGPAVLSPNRILAGGSYMARISAGGMPVITATGHVAVANSAQFIERRVRVLTAPQPAFRVGMAARRGIDFKGNKILINSYDSGDPNHSDANGEYDAATAKAGGTVASTEGFINVGNAEIKGKLYTGPLNEGEYYVGPQGSVGDLSWAGPGIEPRAYFNDFNMSFPPVDEPYATGVPPTAGPGSTNTWDLLGGYDYKYTGNVKMGNKDIIMVVDDATLYVTGNFEMSGQIIVAPGATLKLYVGGIKTDLNQVNTDGNAFSFQYYGLPSNKLISWGGNDEYKGTVYAPEAEFRLGGGGTDTYDFQGACVVDKITINGHFNFHYDENLRRRGPVSGFVVTQWQEE